MIPRLAACALALVCVLAVMFLVVFQSRGADFDSDWLLEDLTCEELVSGYDFEIEMMKQIKASWYSCKAYAESPADTGQGELHCALLKKEGLFLQGVINDLAAVHNIKCTYWGQDRKNNSK